jgi:hypothetical protein
VFLKPGRVVVLLGFLLQKIYVYRVEVCNGENIMSKLFPNWSNANEELNKLVDNHFLFKVEAVPFEKGAGAKIFLFDIEDVYNKVPEEYQLEFQVLCRKFFLMIGAAMGISSYLKSLSGKKITDSDKIKIQKNIDKRLRMYESMYSVRNKFKNFMDI